MGHYSTFVVESEPRLENLAELLEEYSGGYGFYEYDYNAVSTDDAKWYSYHEDMHRLSKDYPHVLFVLEQNGEDGEGERFNIIDGDILTRWRKGWVAING